MSVALKEDLPLYWRSVQTFTTELKETLAQLEEGKHTRLSDQDPWGGKRDEPVTVVLDEWQNALVSSARTLAVLLHIEESAPQFCGSLIEEGLEDSSMVTFARSTAAIAERHLGRMRAEKQPDT